MKKAQIKMLETIAVLIVFFFIIAFGLSFYARIRTINLEKEMLKAEEINSIKKANTIYFMPEIACLSSMEETNCFDIYKLNSTRGIIKEDMAFYAEKLGSVTVRIEEIYPEKRDWLVYNNSKNINRGKFHFEIPVKLYDPVLKEISFGLLCLDYYI